MLNKNSMLYLPVTHSKLLGCKVKDWWLKLCLIGNIQQLNAKTWTANDPIDP
jgi:hypothetical protein